MRKLALDLRDRDKEIFAETFEKRSRDVAEEFVLGALGDGGLSHRLVAYGQSFGGAAVVKFARALEKESIPVTLTVQIDSVGRGDDRVPGNVRYALNLYESDGWLIRGEERIGAEDDGKTIVLDYRRFHYNRPPGSQIDLADVPWGKLIFRIAHARMDRDERVWALPGRAIRAACAGADLTALFAGQHR